MGVEHAGRRAYSPESNGLAEAFVGTFKRDYLGDADLRDAESVLTQLAGWFDDYNGPAPHSALGMRSPREYRALTRPTEISTTSPSSAPPHLAQDARSTEGPLSALPPKLVDVINASRYLQLPTWAAKRGVLLKRRRTQVACLLLVQNLQERSDLWRLWAQLESSAPLTRGRGAARSRRRC